MRLIADSGSTKVDWRAIREDGSIVKISSAGINPLYQTKEEIIKDLEQKIIPEIGDLVEEIHFYGAGVSTPRQVETLRECFGEVFPKASTYAYSDLLAAARSLCGDKPGIAAILGTGSNSCYYDGKQIVDNVPASGFILGDEGSGAVLGKKLISDYLKRQLPKDLNDLFVERYNPTYGGIVEKVYREQFPNRYLASFSLFLYNNREHPYVDSLLRRGFEEFFTRNIMHYDYKRYSVGLVGSIAFHYREILKDVAKELGVSIGTIVKSPIEGLTNYHNSI